MCAAAVARLISDPRASIGQTTDGLRRYYANRHRMDAQDYYDHYWSEPGYCPRRERAPDPLRELFHRYVTPSDDCLDLGCGDGGTAGVYLSENARSYIGVDVSQTALKLARERGFEAIEIDDASALPFAESSFDVVVCSEVFEHLLVPQLAAAEALRVLRPNGRLIVTVPNAAYWRDRLDALFGVWQPGGDDRARVEPWRSPHIRFFTPVTLKRMLHYAGFPDVEIMGLPVPLLSRIPVLRGFSRGSGKVAREAASALPSLFAGGLGAVAIRTTLSGPAE